jgi:hypothetical protein
LRYSILQSTLQREELCYPRSIGSTSFRDPVHTMNLENSTLKLLHWRWKYLVPAIIFAVAFYAVDAWVWFLPILSVLVLLLSLPCFLIAAIVCLFRKSRTSAFKVMASIGILFLGIVAVGITNHIRNNLSPRAEL